MLRPVFQKVEFLPVDTSFPETSISSPALPGGSLVAAVFDRRLMRLSDRGGASGLIGERWADLCAEALAAWPPRPLPVPNGDHDDYTLDRIARLDDIPAIASAASRQQLQNPDFLLLGHHDSDQILQAADAKFSVETARSRQVSAEVTQALFQLGPILDDHLTDLASGDIEFRDGVFLCPDFSLTHLMLRHKRGIRKVSVTPEEVTLIPVTATSFVAGLEAQSLIPTFAQLDNLELDYRESLLATIYYFRLVCAGVGCWIDETGPLLAFRESPAYDFDAIAERAECFAHPANSGWDLALRWDESAEQVRQQRRAVEHVATLPISGRQLRERIEAVAKDAGVVAPSVNKLRRMIGAWFRGRLRDDVGPLIPPVAHFGVVLERLGARAQELQPDLASVSEEIIVSAVAEQPAIVEEPPVASG